MFKNSRKALYKGAWKFKPAKEDAKRVLDLLNQGDDEKLETFFKDADLLSAGKGASQAVCEAIYDELAELLSGDDRLQGLEEAKEQFIASGDLTTISSAIKASEEKQIDYSAAAAALLPLLGLKEKIEAFFAVAGIPVESATYQKLYDELLPLANKTDSKALNAAGGLFVKKAEYEYLWDEDFFGYKIEEEKERQRLARELEKQEEKKRQTEAKRQRLIEQIKCLSADEIDRAAVNILPEDTEDEQNQTADEQETRAGQNAEAKEFLFGGNPEDEIIKRFGESA